MDCFSGAFWHAGHLLAAAPLGGRIDELVVFPSWVAAIWLAVVGSAIGSFLNVVVYRLPRGMSLSHPGSQCPACNRPIRARDNLPIVGWFLLRGRCRDCRAPISPRYPAVEATVAGLFLVLAYVELFSAGGNLPGVEPAETVRVLPVGAPFGIYTFHLLLLCSLLAVALINYDGHTAPRSLLGVMLSHGGAMLFVWPEMLPPGAMPPWLLDVAEAPRVAALAYGGSGLVLGGVMGLLLAMPAPAATGVVNDRQSLAGSLAGVGLFLGPVAAAMLGLASTALHRGPLWIGVRRDRGWGRLPWTAGLMALTLVWIAGWSTLVAAVPWLGPEGGAAPLIVALAIAAAVRFLSRGAGQAARTGDSSPRGK